MHYRVSQLDEVLDRWPPGIGVVVVLPIVTILVSIQAIWSALYGNSTKR